jgi:hypothetical protein
MVHGKNSQARHGDCLIERVRGPKVRRPSGEVIYDSHPGSLNFRDIPSH